MKLGPVMLVAELAEFGITLAASTIHRVLVRRGMSRLRDLDVTGEQMRQPARRYEHRVPGDLVHIDVKKIGRIPDGGGWRVHGRGTDAHRASKRGQRPGYAYLHTAIDDRSRLAYTEELTDEKSVTAAGFWARAVEFFAAHGIDMIRRVLTDNGSCYRGKAFNQALGTTAHKFTRPYRPQTNGKVERFHRTLAREWAYRRAWSSNEERAAALRVPAPLQLPSTPHRTRGRPRSTAPHRHQPLWVQHRGQPGRRAGRRQRVRRQRGDYRSDEGRPAWRSRRRVPGSGGPATSTDTGGADRVGGVRGVRSPAAQVRISSVRVNDGTWSRRSSGADTMLVRNGGNALRRAHGRGLLSHPLHSQ